MPIRKQKKLDRLGYGGGKWFKTTYNLDKSFSDPDNNFDPSTLLDAEWTYLLKNNSNDKPSIEENNEDKREENLRVDSITMKALKKQYKKLGSKQ